MSWRSWRAKQAIHIERAMREEVEKQNRDAHDANAASGRQQLRELALPPKVQFGRHAVRGIEVTKALPGFMKGVVIGLVSAMVESADPVAWPTVTNSVFDGLNAIGQVFAKVCALDYLQTSIVSSLRSAPGATARELCARLNSTLPPDDPEWSEEEVERELNALTKVTARDGSAVAIIEKDAAGAWRSLV